MSYHQLNHHGIKGQKWGVRRYQNEDGSLTKKGQERYDKLDDKYLNKHVNAKLHNNVNKELLKEAKKKFKDPLKIVDYINNSDNYKNMLNTLSSNLKTPSGASVVWVDKYVENMGTYTYLELRGGLRHG